MANAIGIQLGKLLMACGLLAACGSDSASPASQPDASGAADAADGGVGPDGGSDAGNGEAGGCPPIVPTGDAVAVSTFHSLSLYWTPQPGAAPPQADATVSYRKQGTCTWSEGLPLRHNPITRPDSKSRGDYRGSLVHLTPGTTYEVRLELPGTSSSATLVAETWPEKFPEDGTIKVGSRTTQYDVNDSGKPGAYRVYDGADAIIDIQDDSNYGIRVDASYVILRNFTIVGPKRHGIHISGGQHIVIEDCDISGWGDRDDNIPNPFGTNFRAAVHATDKKSVKSVVVQRCKLHEPRWGANSWAEKNPTNTDCQGTKGVNDPDCYHPQGPQCIAFANTDGNHVLRYNECWSTKDHYFNDGFGYGSNGSERGFPGADSDVYGNYVANCWDDGLEVEGGGQNVRVWNNYVEETLIPIANAAVSIGPLYVWRNVVGRSYSKPGSQYGQYGPFLKMGWAGSQDWMTGHQFIFHNTIFQSGDNGSGGLGTADNYGRKVTHTVTRNNIFHVRAATSAAISSDSEDSNFDFDLYTGTVPQGHEQNGINAAPAYASGAGLSFATKQGTFQLAPGSPGYQAAKSIPNFTGAFSGAAPDIGAHQSGTGPMKFGVDAGAP